MMIEEVVKRFLKKRGWSQWYNPNAWVNKKCVADPSTQDHTSYAMDIESAFVHEVENLPPFQPMGMPEISKKLHRTREDVMEYYFTGEKLDNLK